MRTLPSKLTLLCWNVEGLLSKFNYPEFFSYVESFHFVCLTETFIEYLPENAFRDFEVFISPAKKLSNYGRRSGGVLGLVRREISSFFQQIPCPYDNILVFKVDGSLFATPCSFLLICVYIPPENSSYYNSVEESNGLITLEVCMDDICSQHPDCKILLCGDLNSRTANYDSSAEWNMHDARSDPVGGDSRQSRDNCLNEFGKTLLSLCASYELTILNGCEEFPESGEFTYLSAHGESVIDYFVVSRDISYICSELKIAHSVLSSHLPLEMTIQSPTAMGRDRTGVRESRIIWDNSLAEQYRNKLHDLLQTAGITRQSGEQGQSSEGNLDKSIDEEVSMLTRFLVEAGECMEKTVIRGKGTPRKFSWYDGECYDMRRKVRKSFRVFKRTLLTKDKELYFAQRKVYKNLIKDKKLVYHKSLSATLCTDMSNSRIFWNHIKRLNHRFVTPPNISKDEWLEYFKRVFQEAASVGALLLEPEPYLEEESEDYLNSEIEEGEIVSAIDQLQTHKACGPDKVIAEMLKSCTRLLLPYLQTLFNAIMNSGLFPKIWRESIIVPLYKKGNRNDPNNYRGISLTSTLSKVFLHVINTRIQEWTEEHGWVSEEQAGFRKGYSTIDNIFTLHGIIERYLGRKKKVYAAFIDYHKAFDSISRDALFSILKNKGINGKVLEILKSMYLSVRSCVRCPDGNTEYFECPSGLKQGCKCSPILFSYVVGEVAKEVTKKGKHGIQLLPDNTTIYILLFADDVVVLSDTPVGLQNQLNSLETASKSVGLEINMTKSKAMVFRLGGPLAAHEQWHIGGEKLEVVKQYNYLGYTFSTKLSCNMTQRSLAIKGKAAVGQSMRPIKKICTSPKVIFRVFDAQVQPILLYGSELWGMSSMEEIERIHLYMLKSFLDVSYRTPNLMVYGDTGRYPMYIFAILRCVKYWLKILKMDVKRLPKKVYHMMIESRSVYPCWAWKLKDLLLDCGFEEIWRQQTVDNETSFLQELKERLICRFEDCWKTQLLTKERFHLYKMFKFNHNLEHYLYDLDKPIFRNVYIRFRLGVSELYVHRFRYSEPTSLLCPSCNESEEDEFHFLFACPAYEDLRVKYLYFCIGFTIQESFNMCFSCDERERVRAVSSYLLQAFRRRTVSSVPITSCHV